MTISRYEIEVQVTNRTTGAKEIATRLEHAYSLSDAVVQASVALTYQYATEIDLKVVRCGPPSEDIRRAASQWLQWLSTASIAARDAEGEFRIKGAKPKAAGNRSLDVTATGACKASVEVKR